MVQKAVQNASLIVRFDHKIKFELVLHILDYFEGCSTTDPFSAQISGGIVRLVLELIRILLRFSFKKLIMNNYLGRSDL